MPDQVRHDTLAPFEAVTTRLKANDPVYEDRVVCLKINQQFVVPEILFFPKLSVSHFYEFNNTPILLGTNRFRAVKRETLRDRRSYRIYGVRSRPA